MAERLWRKKQIVVGGRGGSVISEILGNGESRECVDEGARRIELAALQFGGAESVVPGDAGGAITAIFWRWKFPKIWRGALVNSVCVV